MGKFDFKSTIADKLKEWKSEVEHLNLQLHLGVKEAEEEFEKQKKNVGKWADSIQEEFESISNLSAEQVRNLKRSLDELRLQVALGKAETKEALRNQQEAINKSLHNLKQEINSIYKTSKGEVNEFLEFTENTLDQFHTRFDLIKLKLHLGSMEVKEEWEEKKKALQNKLHDLNVKIESFKTTSEDKLENFAHEMKEVWSHLKKSIKG